MATREWVKTFFQDWRMFTYQGDISRLEKRIYDLEAIIGKLIEINNLERVYIPACAERFVLRKKASTT